MSIPPPDSGSICVITGASSGMGAEFARQLAARGHGVMLVARREERLLVLAEELRAAHGVRVEVVSCDLANPSSRRALLDHVVELGLTVEVLVNNAGFGTAGPFHELDGAREVEMVRTNVEAVVALTAAVVPGMVKRRRGAILNVASTAGFQPLPRQATYAATKAAVLSFSEALHTELGPLGVAVTALCPGPVRTEFMEVAGVEETAAGVPGFVWVDADECARAGLEGLERGRRVVVPNPVVKAVSVAGAHTPHALSLRALRRFYPV
jgi:uncharacterized protein